MQMASFYNISTLTTGQVTGEQICQGHKRYAQGGVYEREI